MRLMPCFSQAESIGGATGRQIYLYAEPNISIRALALGVADLALESR
jgi:hypothetical protein